MAQRQLKQPVTQPPSTEELLALAAKRVELPDAPLELDYQDDVDTLYISLKKNANPTHSKTKLDDSVIYDYENDTLVGIEILDISGQLKYANPS
ncbi:MAG: hypothetical protein QOF62_1744 [Pyrinomonadaceae bacterium]|jgi:uncharacterized protein YuzE|nr:hypothetical protein [Pyrinomonadaceae bacterium]